MRNKSTLSLAAIRREWNIKNIVRFLSYIAAAFLINLGLEMLSRRSFTAGIAYLTDRPWQFFYDSLIILFTLSLSLVFRKRGFFFAFISTVWLGLGLTNCILLGYRATPLTAPDIWLISSVRDIIEIYLSPAAILALMLVISCVIGAIILLWLHAKKYRTDYFFGLFHILLLAAVLFTATVWLLKSGVLASQFPNLPDAYHDNGFAYCFSASAVTQGISEPEDYTEDEIRSILDAEGEIPASRKNTPNIVFVQLESFFDPNLMKDLSFEENPVPCFEALKESCSTGFFYVPSIGAGTANTEFEVISGMNLDHFGVGEYPYKTVVKHRSCDSIVYALKNLGYAAHAIHNNNATFYSRDRVYANFGFDTFTSEEYMHDVEYNPLEWAEDGVLTGEIVKALRSTKNRDLVFTVSVQPHGKYPTEPLEGAQTIAVSGIEDEERRCAFEYYLGQLRQTDAFVGELTQVLESFYEPTVVVFYGDHLPSLQITQEELSGGTVQSTQYVIWSNFSMKKQDRDIQAYQLAALVLDRIGIHEGTVFNFNQKYLDADERDVQYQSDLTLLEYDLLYGERYCVDCAEAPEPTQMRLGVAEIAITDADYDAENLVLTLDGKNFTPFSVILHNGEQIPTEYVSRSVLRAADIQLEQGDTLAVAQISATDTLQILSQTEECIFPEQTIDFTY